MGKGTPYTTYKYNDYLIKVKMITCHSEPEPFTSFRINSAEAKNLVPCIEKCSFAKNEILRRFPFALLRASAHSSE